MSTIITQDIFGIPVSVGAQCLVPVSVTNIATPGNNADITCQAISGGNIGDTNNTAIVGPKQFESFFHPTGSTQIVNGSYLDIVGRTGNLRGTVSSISGSGATAQITVAITNNGNIGDFTVSIVVGPKQLSVVNTQ